MIGAYIKLYGLPIKRKFLALFLSIIATLLIWIVIDRCSQWVLSDSCAGYVVCRYISPTNVVISMLAVYAFANLNISGTLTKVIDILSRASLSVYIIHMQSYVFDSFFTNKLSFLAEYNILITIAAIIVFSAIIYLICTVINFVGEFILNVTLIYKFSDYIGSKLDHLLAEKKSA